MMVNAPAPRRTTGVVDHPLPLHANPLPQPARYKGAALELLCSCPYPQSLVQPSHKILSTQATHSSQVTQARSARLPAVSNRQTLHRAPTLALSSISRQQPTQPPNMSDPRRSMPLTFLSLGPVTSESFPKSQQPKQAGDGHKRRSSSLSSDGKGSAPGYRVLKVAPVHYGEHAGEHQDDWHNAAVVAE